MNQIETLIKKNWKKQLNALVKKHYPKDDLELHGVLLIKYCLGEWNFKVRFLGMGGQTITKIVIIEIWGRGKDINSNFLENVNHKIIYDEYVRREVVTQNYGLQ